MNTAMGEIAEGRFMTEDQFDAQEDTKNSREEMQSDMDQMDEVDAMRPEEFDEWMDNLYAENQTRMDHENAVKGTESPFDLPAETP